MVTTNIIFDLDDTLYMERDYVRSGFNAVAEWLTVGRLTQLKAADLAQYMLQLFNDQPSERGEIFQRTIVEFMLGDFVPQMIDVYRNHRPTIQLDPAVVQGLNKLKEQGRFIGIITDGDPFRQFAKHSALGLDAWIPRWRVIVNSASMFTKPNRESFKEMSQRAEGPYVYIGDNPSKDFQAPDALGWTTVRLLHPEQLHRERPSKDDIKAHTTGWDALFTYLQNLP